jgi:excisionase family DNA binding protein
MERRRPAGEANMKTENQTHDPLEMVTVREAAALLGVSRPTVEKYIKRGNFPSVMIGRCRRIRRRDLESFIRERTQWGWTPYEGSAVDPSDYTAQVARGEIEDDVPF